MTDAKRVTGIPGILIGPAGWSYPDWDGIVYSKDFRTTQSRLPLIASWFDIAEINASFYRIPTVATSRKWIRAVEGARHFRFAAKLHQCFTHRRRWSRQDVAATRAFLDVLQDSGRLAAVLMQFPWSFHFSRENASFVMAMAGELSAYPLAVEVRHDSWWNDDFFYALSAAGIAIVNIDQPQLPGNILPGEQVTAPIAYIRFHGRNAAQWWAKEEPYHGARYDHLYENDELEPWVDRINRISQTAESTIIVMNNHHRGDAILNGMELAAKLGLARGVVPRGLREAHPARVDALPLPVEPARGGQGDLFDGVP